MRSSRREAIEALEGLAPLVARLPEPVRLPLSSLVLREMIRRHENAPDGSAAIRSMAAIAPLIRRVGYPENLPLEAREDRLLAMARKIIGSPHLPATELCRSLGFVLGVLAAQEHVLPWEDGDAALPAEREGLDRLSCLLGYVQGVLAAHGLPSATQDERLAAMEV